MVQHKGEMPFEIKMMKNQHWKSTAFITCSSLTAWVTQPTWSIPYYYTLHCVRVCVCVWECLSAQTAFFSFYVNACLCSSMFVLEIWIIENPFTFLRNTLAPSNCLSKCPAAVMVVDTFSLREQLSSIHINNLSACCSACWGTRSEIRP